MPRPQSGAFFLLVIPGEHREAGRGKGTQGFAPHCAQSRVEANLETAMRRDLVLFLSQLSGPSGWLLPFLHKMISVV